jgi:hypothetical protein
MKYLIPALLAALFLLGAWYIGQLMIDDIALLRSLK